MSESAAESDEDSRLSLHFSWLLARREQTWLPQTVGGCAGSRLDALGLVEAALAADLMLWHALRRVR